MRRAKLKKRLAAEYGRVPDVHYFHGDLEHIRAYFDYRCGKGLDDFLIDETTHNDLELSRVFRRINPGLSTSGEQYLYYMLRSPATDEETFAGRGALIDLMGRDEKLRLEVQLILARLGRTRRADLASAFVPKERSAWRLFLYLLLAALVPVCAAWMILYGGRGIMAFFMMLVLNSTLHELIKRRIQSDFDTVNYSVAMIFALKRIKKLGSPELDTFLEKGYESLERLRSVVRTGGVSAVSDGGPGDIVTTVFLLDLIAYEFLKSKLGRSHADVFAVHESLGRLDAAIAVASYRESLGTWCVPEIDFAPGAPRFEARGMRHPLLENAVPNSLAAERPILVTGSNASGKSTFLKTAALCAIMGQAVCTCTAEGYRASAFRILTSMALRDDVLAGESYYIVETRSLGRILDASEEDGPPVLCVVDEVLRGTNTVERIAASEAVLRSLGEKGALTLAATHDIELCELLGDCCELCHFTERIGGEGMEFDYRLRPGRAASRNAINLLRLMGFEEDIVRRAHDRATRYLETGEWK